MLADYLLAGRKWSGPRAGFNPAGWISWTVGFAVGAFNLVAGLDPAAGGLCRMTSRAAGGRVRRRLCAVSRVVDDRHSFEDAGNASDGKPLTVRKCNKFSRRRYGGGLRPSTGRRSVALNGDCIPYRGSNGSHKLANHSTSPPAAARGLFLRTHSAGKTIAIETTASGGNLDHAVRGIFARVGRNAPSRAAAGGVGRAWLQIGPPPPRYFLMRRQPQWKRNGVGREERGRGEKREDKLLVSVSLLPSPFHPPPSWGFTWS